VVRERFFTPRLRVASYEELNAWLLDRCVAYIGAVCNLAARLCAEAKDGQILVSSRVARAVETVARLEDLGNLELKGLRRPVAACNVTEPISRASAPA